MITSTSNPRIRKVCEYRKKKKSRDKDGVFIAEGERLVLEIPAGRIASVFISASFENNMSTLLRDFLSPLSAQVEVVSDACFDLMSDTDTPQGILAIVRRKPLSAEDVLRASVDVMPLLVILDGLQDPGNLGTILRSAEAAGATGIIMSEGTVDIYSPKVVRSTMGSIFRLPFAYVSDLRATLQLLQKKGIRIAAADMNGDMTYDTFDFASPVALIIGNEGNGLSKTARESTDTFITIPMAGKTESLNAAVCASVLLFDAARKRRCR